MNVMASPPDSGAECARAAAAATLGEPRVREGFNIRLPSKVQGDSMAVQEVGGPSFDKFAQENMAVVVDIWAPWCGPCRMVSPIVDRLSEKYKGKVAFGKMNSDDNGEKAGALGIMSIPTLLFYKEGKLVDRIVGAYPEEVIDEHIRRLL
jgi:thioredoxin 1